MIHNIEWETYPSNLLNNTSHCPKCTEDKHKQKLSLKTEQYKKKLIQIRKDVEIIDEYSGYHKKIKCKCIKHNIEFYSTPRSLFANYTVCPKCKIEATTASHGERIISKWLSNRNIFYIFQHTFDDCKFNLPLKFDFYLPDFNMCVEYDGEQHFKPIRFDGKSKEAAKEEFYKCMARDLIKNEYCKTKNIQLVRIPFWNKDKIKLILNNKINYNSDPQRLLYFS